MAKLFWLQPDASIIEFPLKAEQNLIGRTSRCDVRIKHPGISAEHAVIRVLPGSATVEDLGSTNGTRVNGKKIELHTLRHGDQIGVGRERLMYFAELDDAAKFLQPESIEPFALPAAGGELVNTGSIGPALPPTKNTPAATQAASSRDSSAYASAPPSGQTFAAANSGSGSHLEPDLDPSLLAALPKGASLVTPPLRTPSTAAPGPANVQTAAAGAALTNAPAPMRPAAATTPAVMPVTQPLSASVSVLTGTAAGKRYPLDHPSVTLGKEGKQVIEFLRTGPTNWQIRQREGVTPAYINGDALVGLRDLAAGDVIELTGVRLRFEIALTR